MSTPIPVVRFRKYVGAPSYWTNRYEVLVDGKVIGTVETVEVAHDRKPRGSRIVTRRTYSDRWSYHPKDFSLRGGSRYETRRDATERLLQTVGMDLSMAMDAAEAARNETKAERRALGEG